eukprot:6705872-Pyramimonas_sp.AAC.1
MFRSYLAFDMYNAHGVTAWSAKFNAECIRPTSVNWHTRHPRPPQYYFALCGDKRRQEEEALLDDETQRIFHDGFALREVNMHVDKANAND